MNGTSGFTAVDTKQKVSAVGQKRRKRAPPLVDFLIELNDWRGVSALGGNAQNPAGLDQHIAKLIPCPVPRADDGSQIPWDAACHIDSSDDAVVRGKRERSA